MRQMRLGEALRRAAKASKSCSPSSAGKASAMRVASTDERRT
jgi:hypothetical protein